MDTVVYARKALSEIIRKIIQSELLQHLLPGAEPLKNTIKTKDHDEEREQKKNFFATCSVKHLEDGEINEKGA